MRKELLPEQKVVTLQDLRQVFGMNKKEINELIRTDALFEPKKICGTYMWNREKFEEDWPTKINPALDELRTVKQQQETETFPIEDYMTAQQIKKLFGITQGTFMMWLQDNVLPPFRRYKMKRYWPKAAIEMLIPQ